MTSEIDDFKAALRAAGQPWSRRGMWFAGGGILLLGFLQTILLGGVRLAPALMQAIVPAGVGALALLLVGWIFLIMGVVKRRQWAKAHDLAMPQLTDHGQGA